MTVHRDYSVKPSGSGSRREPSSKHSVIIACLNGAATLGETLDGLVAQEARVDWEIVLADNGSTDTSRSIFQDYARRHPQITMRVVDASAQRGKSYALNVAIWQAAGDRLLFCDADDVVAPGWLAAMARALDRHDLVAARLEYAWLNAPGPRARYQSANRQKQLSTIGFAPYCVHAGGATLGFHRHVFDDVGEFNVRFRTNEDTDWCIRAHLKGYAIVFIPEAVYHYRFRVDPEGIRHQSYAYAWHLCMLRKLYASPPRGPRAALAWASTSYIATALTIGERLRRRTDGDPAAAYRRAKRLGEVTGDLAGARAHGVPPMFRGFGPLPHFVKSRVQAARLAALGLVQPAVLRVRTEVKAMALTFDDGPDPATTPVLLDLLARLGAKATFFLVGARAQRHPELVARIAAEGHEIGNHGWSHRSLPTLSEAEITRELTRTREVLQGQGQALMRPPFGDATAAVNTTVRRLGYTMVIWNVSGEDWYDDDAETIARRILDRARPGAIVLLHDSLYNYVAEAYRDRAPTFAAVERVVQALPDWRFVTVSELTAFGRPVKGGWRKTSPKSFLTGLQWAEGHDAHQLADEAI